MKPGTEPTTATTQRFRFFIFTGRNPSTDFRRPLVEALRRLNYETYYITSESEYTFDRRPWVSGPSEHDPLVEMSRWELLNFFLRFRRGDKINVYFNSTSTAYPFLSLLLKIVARRGVWCLDFHDDLYYDYTGLTRLRAILAVGMMRLLSDVAVHASPQLTEVFPGSLHLGNASHLLPLQRDNVNPNGILVITSFDARFDFEFFEKVAQSSRTSEFHVYGSIDPSDTAILEWVRGICERNANIHYHGAYSLDDLPIVLRDFKICLAPYRTGVRATRYIDPLRFYHCLNSGMEVVSTDIPQARRMIDWVHVVRDPLECAETLMAIQAGKLTKLAGYRPITWEQRVDRLIAILNSCRRTVRLRSKLPPQAAGAEDAAVSRDATLRHWAQTSD